MIHILLYCSFRRSRDPFVRIAEYRLMNPRFDSSDLADWRRISCPNSNNQVYGIQGHQNLSMIAPYVGFGVLAALEVESRLLITVSRLKIVSFLTHPGPFSSSRW